MLAFLFEWARNEALSPHRQTKNDCSGYGGPEMSASFVTLTSGSELFALFWHSENDLKAWALCWQIVVI
jgi:hypothetical protein